MLLDYPPPLFKRIAVGDGEASEEIALVERNGGAQPCQITIASRCPARSFLKALSHGLKISTFRLCGTMRSHEGGAGALRLSRFVPAPALIATNPGKHDKKRGQDKPAIPGP